MLINFLEGLRPPVLNSRGTESPQAPPLDFRLWRAGAPIYIAHPVFQHVAVTTLRYYNTLFEQKKGGEEIIFTPFPRDRLSARA